MNIIDISYRPSRLLFSARRYFSTLVPGGRLHAFGDRPDQIGAVLVINLDRQPGRWRRLTRELRRFRTADGATLLSKTNRMPAIDARDARATAATGDVDPVYRIAAQLFVQPDAQLERTFSPDQTVRMTPQEVAVARSHIEAWKSVANGAHNFVLVLEDDVWFTTGARGAINQGWSDAVERSGPDGPDVLYFSYSDAIKAAKREGVGGRLFRATQGLWFLSGYVLSRRGAQALLHAMPVVGPVDMWINARLQELDALALDTPVILQRQDETSSNSYSVLPYLARAGTIDYNQAHEAPTSTRAAPVLAWAGESEHDALAMALSMLGLRVRVFDGTETPLSDADLHNILGTFDALIDAPLTQSALASVQRNSVSIIVEANASPPLEQWTRHVSSDRVLHRSPSPEGDNKWTDLCDLLGLDRPVDAYPTGAHHMAKLFHQRHPDPDPDPNPAKDTQLQAGRPAMDTSPWVLPAWHSRRYTPRIIRPGEGGDAEPTASHRSAVGPFQRLHETFPGNLAMFTPDSVRDVGDGPALTLDLSDHGLRTYCSGALGSEDDYGYGRFEAHIKAAPGEGLITGFFLHRASPRQEIDIELLGARPNLMLINIYFNPGDDGTNMSFGYRGTPHWVDLGFDSTAAFHRYAIDWNPHRVQWIVDKQVVHERLSWDPTPIPHLPMRLHGNLWAPRSHELAGTLDNGNLPATAHFANITMSGWTFTDQFGA